MGRLKRKRPASQKKVRRKTAQQNSGQGNVKEQVSAGVAQQKPFVPKVVTAPKKEVPKAITPSGRKLQPAFWVKTIQFLREVKIELKKVTWPSRKETVASTAVVIVLVVIVASFLGLVDWGLSGLIRFVLR
jgi:preprotein translocase subunit SecE